MSVISFPTYTVSAAFAEFVDEAERRSLAGDEFATKALGAMALLNDGWRYGYPDPVEPDPDGGGEPVREAA